jgi:mono/diheme cytochrome c family protein
MASRCSARAGVELTDPFHPTEQVIDKGKQLFQIYCAVCHGAEGKGDGPIAAKIPPPPSYKSDRLLQFPPGRFFHVITMGANKMPSYAVQLAPEERWLLITYIRAQLQGLPEAPPGTLPAETMAMPGPVPAATLGLSIPSGPQPASGSGGSK